MLLQPHSEMVHLISVVVVMVGGGEGSEQLATPAASRAQGQALISDCWVKVGGWRLWLGRDKS